VARIRREPALRTELGENGYGAFRRQWTREAHLDAYFDHLRRAAVAKLGRVPWEEEARAAG
jgi:hypothetical protein